MLGYIILLRQNTIHEAMKYFVLLSVCEYGQAVCQFKKTTFKWNCPVGEKLLARAFWGRDPGDDTTCTDGVPQGYLQNLNCPGSDEKALAAVSEWLGDNKHLCS